MKLSFSILLVTFLALGGVQTAFAQDASIPMPSPTPAISGSTLSQNEKELGPHYLSEAEKAYSAGHYKEALNLIGHAQNSIRTKHADMYRPLLPATPSGWQSSTDVESATLGAQMLGGASVVARKYTANGQTVTISFIIDSPTMALLNSMVQAIASSSAPGSSIETIKNNKAVYKEQHNAKTGVVTYTLTVLVGDIAVLVSSPTLGRETLVPFANIVDYDSLKKVE